MDLAELDPGWARRLRAAAACFAAVGALVGAAVLLGWAIDAPLLKAPLSQITMKANAALGLLACGVALWLLLPEDAPPARRRIGQALALFVAVLGAANLSQHLFGWDLRIDQVLFAEPQGALGTVSPGRFGPLASVGFLALGLGLLGLDARKAPIRHTARAAAAALGALMLLPLIGYAYGVEALYGIARLTAIAAHTSVALLALALGVLVARPDEPPLRTFASALAGGAMARRLLPALAVPILLGWVSIRAEATGMVDNATGTSLLVTAVVVFTAVTIWTTAVVLNRSDAHRRAGAEALRALNATLERRVAQRTDQLRLLALELSQLEHRERRRLAEHLHDDLAQALAISKMKLSMLRPGEDDGRGARALEEAKVAVGEAIAHVRTLMYELNPPMLHDLGLAAALQGLGERLQSQHRLEVAVTVDPALPPLDADRRSLLYHAGRELLLNAIKHARCRRIRVSLALHAGDGSASGDGSARGVALSVEDDGVGFDPASLTWKPGMAGGFGLFNLRERLAALGGRLEIASAPGRGARLAIQLPVGDGGSRPQPRADGTSDGSPLSDETGAPSS